MNGKEKNVQIKIEESQPGTQKTKEEINEDENNNNHKNYFLDEEIINEKIINTNNNGINNQLQEIMIIGKQKKEIEKKI